MNVSCRSLTCAPSPPQWLCVSSNPRVPDPRPRARDFTRAISRRDRHRHRRRELYGLRRHERHRAHASAIHRRASHRQSPPSSSTLSCRHPHTPDQNKWEHISERALDDVLEHLYTLNEHTPKIRCAGKSIDPALIFGVDSKLFRDGDDSLPLSERTPDVSPHHDEVETVTLLRGGPALPAPAHGHGHHDKAHACDHPPLSHPHPHPEESTTAHSAPLPPLDEPALSSALRQLPKESVYRVKGFIHFTPTPTAGAGADSDHEGDARRQQWWILNWAFGRWDLVRASTSPFAAAEDGDEREVVRLTVMGERGEVRRSAKKLAAALGAAVVN